MQDVSTKDGRTVIFVSHNMGVLKSICNRGILLDKGKIEFENNAIEKVVSRYYNSTDTIVHIVPIIDRIDRVGDGSVFIEQFTLVNMNKNAQLELGNPISFRVSYHSKAGDLPYKFLISINSFIGDCVVFLDSSVIPDFPSPLRFGRFWLTIGDVFCKYCSGG